MSIYRLYNSRLYHSFLDLIFDYLWTINHFILGVDYDQFVAIVEVSKVHCGNF